MSSDYNDNLWNDVLKELQNNIQPRHYEFWFQNSKILALTDKAVKIQVSNEIIKQKIKENYLEHIKNSLFKCSGNELEIEFICEAKAEQQALFDFEIESEQVSQEVKDSTTYPPINLNSLYTFANFVVGPSNELAHSASVAVAKAPGKAYNPLFLHGAVGLGKTHLLQAICNGLISQGYNQQIVYLSCEEFVNEFISAIEDGNLGGFRYKYRSVSMILIDDIHFLAGKDRTQEEFFHTFNTLYNCHKQIILSSDSPPSEIPELKERLVSRFKWGLVATLDVPGFETRVAIVKKKAKLKNKELPDGICQYISENIVSNIRELEGAVNHLLAMAELHKKEITLDFCKRALKDIIRFNEPEIELSDVLEATIKFFNIKITDLQSKNRQQTVVLPRQVGMYLAKKLTKYSLQEIGAFFGGRDHTTVLHALDKIKELSQTSPRVTESLVEIEKQILEKKY
ncbi:MAG: chromosomal replication initiator protein DnaA [Candidatus Brocadiae bacterium]|nr:chromosomal replication initiator protein DnaA [Candidatus Brocadiia bacterium]